MPRRKKITNQSAAKSLADRIKKTIRGLYYTSETDAEITPFVGEKAEDVTAAVLLMQAKLPPDSPVEERDFNEFFSYLTGIQDWFGDEERKTARKFSDLRDLLQKELTDLKVFKVGKIELDVYVVGLDTQSVLTGIQTKAVET